MVKSLSFLFIVFALLFSSAQLPGKKQKKVKKKVKYGQPLTKKPKNDTIYHRFKTGELSAKVPPMVNGRRVISIYNRRGKVVHTGEEISMSFHVHCDLDFYDDGGIRKVIHRTIPDAGLYSGETTVFFNEQQVKTSEVSKSLEGGAVEELDKTRTIIYKEDGTKIEQKAIECQPPYIKK